MLCESPGFPILIFQSPDLNDILSRSWWIQLKLVLENSNWISSLPPECFKSPHHPNTQNTTLRSGSAAKHERHREDWGKIDLERYFFRVFVIAWAFFLPWIIFSFFHNNFVKVKKILNEKETYFNGNDRFFYFFLSFPIIPSSHHWEIKMQILTLIIDNNGTNTKPTFNYRKLSWWTVCYLCLWIDLLLMSLNNTF